MCGPDAATTPEVCTNGLEKSILPQFDPRKSSLALLEAKIPSQLQTTGKKEEMVFLATMVCVVVFSSSSCRYGYRLSFQSGVS